MRVERVYNDADRPIFPAYRYCAAGQTSNGPVIVGLTGKEFQRLKPGDNLDVIETGSAEQPFITRGSFDTQLGWVRFSLFGIPFNDVAIFGCASGLAAIIWAFFGRRIANRLSESRGTGAKEDTAPANT